MSLPSEDPFNPKTVAPTASSTGYITSVRLFGSPATLRVAMEYMLAKLSEEDLEEDSPDFLVKQEMAYHALMILGRPIPASLRDPLKSGKWRATRSDTDYFAGAMTRSRRAISLIADHFQAPATGAEAGFWEWHGAAVAAVRAAEAQVSADVKAKVKLPKLQGKIERAPMTGDLKPAPVAKVTVPPTPVPAAEVPAGLVPAAASAVVTPGSSGFADGELDALTDDEVAGIMRLRALYPRLGLAQAARQFMAVKNAMQEAPGTAAAPGGAGPATGAGASAGVGSKKRRLFE